MANPTCSTPRGNKSPVSSSPQNKTCSSVLHNNQRNLKQEESLRRRGVESSLLACSAKPRYSPPAVLPLHGQHLAHANDEVGWRLGGIEGVVYLWDIKLAWFVSDHITQEFVPTNLSGMSTLSLSRFRLNLECHYDVVYIFLDWFFQG